MERDYKKFLDNYEQDEFLNDLSRVLAYPKSDFQDINIRKGCVILEAVLPTVAVLRAVYLWDLFKKSNTSEIAEKPKEKEAEEATDELTEFSQLVKKHRIIHITKNHPSKLNLLSKEKSLLPTGRAIIFIHGWRFEGSLYKNENKLGLLERPKNTYGKLPKFLEAEFGAFVEEYEYPTGIIVNKPSYFDIAKSLSNTIQEFVVNKNCKDIVLIGHSAGGVAIRKCMTLDAFQKDRNSTVKQITFISCPYTGVQILRLLKLFFPNDQVNQLAKGSAFLNELNSHWSDWKNRPNTITSIRCIYCPEDSVIDAADATIDDPHAVPILGADHVSIKNADEPDSLIVKTLISFLKEFI